MGHHGQVVDNFVEKMRREFSCLFDCYNWKIQRWRAVKHPIYLSCLFDNGIHVSSSGICVILSNSYIPYCLSQIEQPSAAPSPSYRSCTFGGGARQWCCILRRTVQGRSMWFPLVFPSIPSGVSQER